ncbi:wax ester/triacylglycerol synthase domain-containing protein [Aliiglaciecola sp. M165]|uniref:wax ester/triacylglycerol synthase domain-containing protein n=1 Tax=Aliiglaciecola sp. M165 TaxID=2593649 RepID=UPI00117D0188|nr:wax ester/triacylglycerol synthase domain-containing protein [Aliiglaciecola sp. M165]TRY29840.1 DUF1298 domain-containing protein [Aliiglaciecola sp. M165]
MHLMDRAFYFTETEASPKHVAGRILLHARENSENIVNLVTKLRSFTQAFTPFNCIVKSRLGWPVRLQSVAQLNMEYHIQLHNIADTENAALVDELIGQLHQSLLDRTQPLWQCHVIYSESSQVSIIYVKVHHAYGDGVMLLKRVMGSFSEKPNEQLRPFWTMEKDRNRKERRKSPFKRFGYHLVSFCRSTYHMSIILLSVVGKMLRLTNRFFTLPFSASKTPINGQVRYGRSVATLQIPLARMTKLSRQSNSSINDLLLTCSDLAVNRFLRELGFAAKDPLVCMMPINVRAQGDESEGNKIAIVLLPLAKQDSDPLDKLEQIKHSDSQAKQIAHRFTPLSLMHYTMFYQSLGILFEILKLFHWSRPINNFLLSNLKGPEQTLYLGEHQIASVHPISIVPPGGGFNISLISYQDNINIGVVSCSDLVKDCQPLGEYFNEAFNTLERLSDLS